MFLIVVISVAVVGIILSLASLLELRWRIRRGLPVWRTDPRFEAWEASGFDPDFQ